VRPGTTLVIKTLVAITCQNGDSFATICTAGCRDFKGHSLVATGMLIK